MSIEFRRALPALLFFLVPFTLHGAEHRVEALTEAPPGDAVAPTIAGLLSPTGFKVVRGESRTVCEIWLCKQWQAAAGERPEAVNYPLAPGSLVGVVRFPKKGSDFRDQDIAEGVYTLRYGQQPVDGAHVGTSPTRDFLLLLPAAQDTAAGVLDYRTMTKQSAEAAGSSHPLLLSMQRAEAPGEPLAIRHVEEPDWWIVRFVGKAKGADVPVDLIVAGHAEEL